MVCSSEGSVLPDLTKLEYLYSKDPPDLENRIHVRRAETALFDYYHGYPKCRTTERINRYVQGVPHRIKRTELDPEGTAYGLYARQGWTLYRLALFAMITKVGRLYLQPCGCGNILGICRMLSLQVVTHLDLSQSLSPYLMYSPRLNGANCHRHCVRHTPRMVRRASNSSQVSPQ